METSDLQLQHMYVKTQIELTLKNHAITCESHFLQVLHLIPQNINIYGTVTLTESSISEVLYSLRKNQ